MDRIIEGVIIAIGAPLGVPLVLLTPTAGLVICVVSAFNHFAEAKRSENILSFCSGIFFATCAFIFLLTAIEAFFKVYG